MHTMCLIQNEWPTQQQDMEAANGIIDRHLNFNEGEPLGFLEIIMYKNEQGEKSKVELKMPEWIVELQHYFRQQYGNELGHSITSKVLTKFLLKNETLH